jgi:hypothetical protein
MVVQIPKKDFELLKTLMSEEGFEKIVWSYTGIKKASHYSCRDDSIKKVLEKLGLEVKDGVIKQIGWDLNNIVKAYDHKPNDFTTGIFFGYPECCSLKYYEDVKHEEAILFGSYPFRGLSTVEEVEKLYESIHENKEECDNFFKDLNKHIRLYMRRLFEEGVTKDDIKERRQGMKSLVESGDLPEHVYLLLVNCVPCKPNCKNFITKTQEMYESLKLFGKEYVDNILEKYKKCICK